MCQRLIAGKIAHIVRFHTLEMHRRDGPIGAEPRWACPRVPPPAGFLAEKARNRRAQQGADDRRQPEEPELAERPIPDDAARCRARGRPRPAQTRPDVGSTSLAVPNGPRPVAGRRVGKCRIAALSGGESHRDAPEGETARGEAASAGAASRRAAQPADPRSERLAQAPMDRPRSSRATRRCSRR